MSNELWFVPDDYASRLLIAEAEFYEKEAIETSRRGCKDYVINHYQRRAELLRNAIEVLEKNGAIA